MYGNCDRIIVICNIIQRFIVLLPPLVAEHNIVRGVQGIRYVQTAAAAETMVTDVNVE